MPAEKVSANQSLFNASVRHQVHVLRFSEQQAKEALEALRAAEAELLEKITGAMAKGLDVSRMEAVLTSVQQRRKQVYEQLAETMEANLKAFSEIEADWEVGALDGASPVRLNTARVPLEQLHATVSAPIAGIPLKGWLDNIGTSEATALQAAVTQAVLQGQTIDDLVRRIRGTKARDYADGILSTSTRNAQALARTAVNHVSNSARGLVWEANKDIVRALRWTSTLDGRTSPVCRARDGHLTPVGETPLMPGDQPLVPAGAVPPAHFNCRSLLVAVLDGVELAGDRPFVRDSRVRKDREAAFRKEAKERGITIQQVRKEWADKNVGQLPAKTTYGEWLKSQPAEFQDEVLGRGKAQLFRDGLPLERFIDKSGRTLSLTELKAELAGDALNVLQPAIGVKAKGLLMQGLEPDDVLKAIKSEFPEASTSAASIASYKSELNKAGLLPTGPKPTAFQTNQAWSIPTEVSKFEAKLSPGVKGQLQGQWASVVETLDGHPGAYAHYKPGVGVQLSNDKLMKLPPAQVQQVMAHELGHMLHKVHGLDDEAGLKFLMDDWKEFVTTDPTGQAKKLYSYYGTSKDELWAEVLGQALHDSPVTSQGIDASMFKSFFASYIEDAKGFIAKKFPDAPPALPTGPVVKGLGEVPGKPTSIGGYAKALLQQGMPDDQVLTAVKAEFPNAKTSPASIASYKSQLKKAEKDAVGTAGPTVSAKGASPDTPKPVAPVPDKVTGYADPAAEVPKASGDVTPLSGLTKTGSKPGGSNPGALYADAKGDEWLVKGNLQKVNNSVTAEVSDARAKNEVLAASLIRAYDKGLAPEMQLVDLEGQYGGGLGVQSRMLDKPIVKFDPKNAAHVAAAQEDFALHAWLGNWDVVGASYDNLVMKGGKAVNIDPGGALLFRAQGLPKGAGMFDEVVEEWTSMRKGTKNPQAKAVYGSMTDEQLVASAKKLTAFTDDVIDEMVDAYGPGAPAGMSNDQLKKVLKGRRDDLLKNAGIKMPAKPVAVPDIKPLKVVDADTLDQATFGVKEGLLLTDAEVNALVAALPDSTVPSASNVKGALSKISGQGGMKLLGYAIDMIDDGMDDDMLEELLLNLKTLKEGGKKASSADAAVLAAKDVTAKAQVAQAKAYKQMTPKELMDALVPAELELKSYWGQLKTSTTIQSAAVPLFKAGLKTDMVKKVLDLKFGEKAVPKVTSLASMKSKLKKQGLLDGPIGAPVPGAAQGLAKPALWDKQLGGKSSKVKDDAKALIQSNTAPETVVQWIATQFSSPNPKGAQDLYELAFYEVKTGKAQVKKGVAAVSQSYYSQSLPAPVPLRPAARIGEAGPPPPRFTPEGHRAGLQKYGGLGDTTGLAALNKRQKAAKLEELTEEEFGALRAYTGSAYREVNRKLRDGEFTDDVYLQAWSDAAMQGMHKLPPWRGEVVRGMSVGPAEVAKLKKFYRIGAVVEEVQFTSTADAAAGSGFGGNVRYRIKTKSGRDIRSFSKFKSEQEVLLVPGVKYKVTKVEDTSGGMNVFMEEV